MTNEQLVSEPLSKEAARDKCEEAANVLIARNNGFWHWMDEKRLCVFKPNGDLFATLHVEQVQ